MRHGTGGLDGGGKHSDHPRCTCPIIAAFVRGLNDEMPDDIRQELTAHVPRLIGTVAPERRQLLNEFFCLAGNPHFCACRTSQMGLQKVCGDLGELWDAGARVPSRRRNPARNTQARTGKRCGPTLPRRTRCSSRTPFRRKRGMVCAEQTLAVRRRNLRHARDGLCGFCGVCGL